VSGQEVTIPTGPAAPMVAQQASSDEQLLALWLAGRGPHTRRAYGAGRPNRAESYGSVFPALSWCPFYGVTP
jgi:hypothetical protein